MPADTAMTLLRQRAAHLRTVRGEVTLTLTDAKGQSVTLDAVVLIEPPARARLRAWKLGTAVFDLTLRDGEAWAYFPREAARPAAPRLRQSMARWLGLLGGRDPLFDQPATADGDDWVLCRTEDGQRIECRVDRGTLTPRLFRVFAGDTPAFELTLSDYREAGPGQVWPDLIRAEQFVGGRQVLEIRTRDVEVNGDLPADAFRPPARAEALP